MKISYNWLKWYIPEAPSPEKLADTFILHLCEVESIEKTEDGDSVFDIKILPDRAHDLLSHQGVARELASLLNIKFVDPTFKYKIPESKKTDLEIEIQSDKCRRYMGRIIRNVKVGPSPAWVVQHLESIGQRSINNMVDAANIVMFDCGQPTHVFDLNKVSEKLIVRFAKDDEELTTLDNKNCKLKSSNLVIATSPQPSPDRRGSKGEVLAIAGVKGGKIAEVDNNTTDIILEVANFDPISVRKTAQMLNIFTDAKKRFENELSPELCSYAMLEFSALIFEMCPETSFEDVVDIYPVKQIEKKLSFSIDKISKILGVMVSIDEIKDILRRYNFEYKNDGDIFEIVVPYMRYDLAISEDMAEEVGRILGYDKVKPEAPKINFKIKVNEIYEKMLWTRNKLLNDGYSEVMNTTFSDKGEVSVLASASDKNFLRINLSDGLKESLKLNKINLPLLGLKEVKIFEIGTVFAKDKEEIRVAYNEGDKIIEKKLEEYDSPLEEYPEVLPQGEVDEFSTPAKATPQEGNKFKMWSLFPFIARDVAVWVPEEIESEKVSKIIKENMGDMVVRGPELFDEFKKDGKISYAFRLVFQSYERTLNDQEVNDIMTKITNKIKENIDWQVR